MTTLILVPTTLGEETWITKTIAVKASGDDAYTILDTNTTVVSSNYGYVGSGFLNGWRGIYILTRYAAETKSSLLTTPPSMVGIYGYSVTGKTQSVSMGGSLTGRSNMIADL